MLGNKKGIIFSVPIIIIIALVIGFYVFFTSNSDPDEQIEIFIVLVSAIVGAFIGARFFGVIGMFIGFFTLGTLGFLFIADVLSFGLFFRN